MDFAAKIIAENPGKTGLFSVGQAGFIIRSKSGQLLGIDMYLSNCLERVEGHIGFKRLLPKILSPGDLIFDGIVATHPHYDHFDRDSIPELMDNGRTRLFASIKCEKEMKSIQMTNQRTTYVKPGEHYEMGDFMLDFVSCDHGTGAPDAVGVLVTVDGKRILEVGDTCLRLDFAHEYLKNGVLDVLIAPINGAYGNLNEEDCAHLSGALNPKLTIPCHYGMLAAHGGNPWVFYNIMKEKYPANNLTLLRQGEVLIIE